MLIQQSIDKALGVVERTPSALVSSLLIGQKLDAIVMTSAQATQIVTIKVADTLIDIRSPIPLQAGQLIQLEVVEEGGKATLKLIENAQALHKISENSLLKIGQQLSVDVIKVLANNRLLVETKLSNASTSQKQTFDIDVSQIKSQAKVADKLTMNIVMLKPLMVQIVPEKQSRELIVADRIKQLLPQVSTPANLNNLVTALKSVELPGAIKQEVQNVLQNIVNKSDITKANTLQQALKNSGSFTEKQLLTQPESISKDFKANLLKLTQSVESELTPNSELKTSERKSLLPVAMKLTSLSQAMTLAKLLGRQVPLESVANILTPQASVNAKNILLSPQLLTQLQAGAPSSLLPEFVRNMPIEQLTLLLKEAEGVHSKLQLNQLAMLRESEPSISASWILDLPLKDKSSVDMLQLQIEQHKKKKGSDDDAIWSVKLRLDTQNLGAVQATVTMNSDDVKIVLRAEEESSASLLEENVDLLQKALSKLAISVSHISCCCGDVDKAILKEADITSSDSLVDESV